MMKQEPMQPKKSRIVSSLEKIGIDPEDLIDLGYYSLQQVPDRNKSIRIETPSGVWFGETEDLGESDFLPVVEAYLKEKGLWLVEPEYAPDPPCYINGFIYEEFDEKRHSRDFV